MAVITRTAQHGILAIEFLREEHTVTVKRQEGILTLEKLLEVKRIADADCRAVITVTPSNPIAVINLCNTRVILVIRVNHIGVTGLELDWFMLDIPVNAVFTESGKDIHLHSLVVATENSGIATVERHHGTIENTIG